jgi:hypothetical protein
MNSAIKIAQSSALAALFCIITGLLVSCGGGVNDTSSGPKAYYLSHHPDDKKARQLRHYPVARQGNLTAWVTSNHVGKAVTWLYEPGNPVPKYPIVGKIMARHMPAPSKHDGSFLIVRGYNGPLYDLWTGSKGEGQLFTGKDWVPVKLEQLPGVNTWVLSKQPIGGWSGYPVVIGNPAKPDAIGGAMWYRHNKNLKLGGTTASRFLKAHLAKLRFEDFVRD